MTNRTFGAPAPITPPAPPARKPGSNRVARGAWLIARLVRQQPVRRKEYQEHFGRAVRSFCCEVAALRSAGIYRGSELLDRPIAKPWSNAAS